jgi:3-oxoisoapionate decarboxylase
MRLGIDSFSYHLHFGKHWFKPSRVFDLKWFCQRCHDLNVDGVHLDPMHIDIANDIDWLKDYACKHNLFIELGAMDIKNDELKPSIIAAKELNSKILRIFIGGSCEEGREVSKKRSIQAKEDIKRSLEIAEKYNITLALENHGDLFFDDFLNILSINSPFLGVCFDSGNFASIGVDPKEALAILIEKVVCTHLKDAYPPDTYPDAETFGMDEFKKHFGALGGGTLPLKEIVEMIRKEKGEEFNISLEIHSPYRKSLSEENLL